MKSSEFIKSIVVAGVISLLLFGINACKKDSSPSVSGKWLIQNDSTRIIGNDSFLSSHFNYIGQAGGYYDFRSDGFLYTREGIVLDTMVYQINTNGSVGCSPAPGFNDSYDTHFANNNQVTLTVNGNTPKGQLIRIVNLNR